MRVVVAEFVRQKLQRTLKRVIITNQYYTGICTYYNYITSRLHEPILFFPLCTD